MSEADDDAGYLGDFLASWREEIRGGGRPDSRGKRKLLTGATSDSQGSPSKRTLSDSDASSLATAPLLVLPAGHVKTQQRSKDADLKDMAKKEEGKGRPLIDILISDLDEINTIPFFDVQLPREIAVVIFGFLGMRDLCRCAVVSKSWSSLAGDNLLWYKIYQSVQTRPVTLCSESPLWWKYVVQELTLKLRQVERNWKERICGLSDYQPDDCRVICCASYYQGIILSCYSSGAVCTWELSSDLVPQKARQIPGPYLTSEPACCDLGSSWAVLGTNDGCLKILDVGTHSQVYSLSDLGCVDSVSVSRAEGYLAVGVASHHAESTASLSVLVAGQEESWERTQLPMRDASSRLTKVKVLTSQQGQSCVLYSTPTSLTLHPLHPLHSPLAPPTQILDSIAGGGATCLTCFEANREMSTVACGTSAFGYQVQLFDLPSGSCCCTLKGHGQMVTSVSLPPTPHMVVSGSADKRVRVFDCRCHAPFPVMTLRGHGGCVKCVQMDQWKVVSGSSDGSLVLWDQRMAAELWRTHERHAVDYCGFDEHYLVCAHVPLNKHPIRIQGVEENPNICHRRSRGLVRVMDFSVESMYYTKKLPSICSSNYDEPSASFFNLDLKFPYDAIS